MPAAAQIDDALGTIEALCAKAAVGDEDFLKRLGGGAGGDGQSVRWSGSIAQSGGRWGGSGRWTSIGGPGGNCSGTWQSQ